MDILLNPLVFWDFLWNQSKKIFCKKINKMEMDILELNFKKNPKPKNKGYQGKLDNYPTFQISFVWFPI